MATLAAAGAVLVFWSMPAPPVDGPRGAATSVVPRVVDGTFASESIQELSVGKSPTRGAWLEARSMEATIALADGTRLRVVRHTRMRLEDVVGQHWMLERGTLQLDVEPQSARAPLSVKTGETRITVVGTAFSVDRDAASDPPTTTVAVAHGVVEVVAFASGAAVRLHAGQSRTWPPIGVADAPPNPTPARGAVRASVATRLAAIRSRIDAGDVLAARDLLQEVERRRDLRRFEQAELGLLRAEAAMSERHYDDAVVAYLRVAERFADLPQGETGLFGAAQLSVDHPTRAGDGVSLLQRYLSLHPQGRFAREAALLLRAADARSP